jgi:hypothetical protein
MKHDHPPRLRHQAAKIALRANRLPERADISRA